MCATATGSGCKTLLGVPRSSDGGKQFAGWGRACCPENNPAIFANDHDGSGDAIELALDHRPFGLERVVLVCHAQPLVHQQIKGEPEVFDEALMARRVAFVDAVGFGIEGAELGNRVTHGGKLIRSAARHILRIENQQCPLVASQ